MSRFFLDDGDKNTLVGYKAGNALDDDSDNTFIGYEAGEGGTTSAPYSSGESNVAIGYEALKAFTTGVQIQQSVIKLY